MTRFNGLGIVLSLVFGCLMLALVAELYYLLWWKKQRLISNNSNNFEEEDYRNHTKELFYLFCRDKPNSIINNPDSNPEPINGDPDIELGLDPSKDLVLKALREEESMDLEIMRLHNLVGPPRFLFTIKEETMEDLESDDGKSRGFDRRTRSLSDLIMAIDTQNSPKLLANNYNNPLFESSMEAELMNRLRSSPPPKFKFLRDAEEKLFRKLLKEAQENGFFQEIVIEDGNLLKSKVINCEKNKERDFHGSSQVLPLASSPPNPV